MIIEVNGRPLNIFQVLYYYTRDEKQDDGTIIYNIHYRLSDGRILSEGFFDPNARKAKTDVLDNTSFGGLVQKDTYGDFPEKGSKGSIYIAKDTGQTYYWDVRTATYVTTGTAGRTGVYSYAGDLSTVIGTDTVLNQTDLSVLVEPTVPFSEGSEVVAANSVHGMIISRTSTTVTVKTITDMTIDSFQQVATLADLPTTGFENILYAVKDIDEFRAWDSVNNEWYAPAMVYTGVNNTQIHVSVNADREIEAELQDGSVAKTHLTQALQDDLDSLTVLPTYNSTTHKITFTTLGGSTYEIDLPMEDAVDSVTYDPSTKKITVHKFSGTVNYIDLSDLANYVAGNGIEIDNKTIKIKLDSSNSNGLVSTASGLGLNTVTESSNGAMTAVDKIKLNGLENYDDTDIKAALNNKVDKVTGKGLSTNDYTTAEKEKLAGLENYDDTTIRNLIDLKVDKVSGKGLSTNDFTNADKTKLDSLENYDDTDIKASLNNKVDKETGKGLSTNDFTTALKTKLENLDPDAEENVIETIKVNGTAQTVTDKTVDITIGEYTLTKNPVQAGYPTTYNLKKDNVVVGDTIEVPENTIIKGGTIGTVDTPDVPYEGAKVGDKYIDLELDSTPPSHVYVPLKDLIVGYTAGDGIDISGANEIRAIIDSNLANGLQSTATGIGLNLVTLSRAGAMSSADKYKLDGLSNYDDTAILTALDNKVDKVSGKGLSTNDYTNDEKTKLAGIERGAQVNTISTIKVNNAVVSPVDKTVSLTIPTKTSDITNDLHFVADANYTHTDNNYTDSEKNKLASLSNYDDSNLRNLVNTKQDELVSGTNIKTINNQSLLGSGNIEIDSEAVLSSTLTTNKTVGWCESGTTFAKGTKLEDILRTILYKDGEPTPVVSYTVSFNTYGGSAVASQIVEDGQKATKPATDPTKSGYTFDNWYTTSSYDTLFNFNNVITGDTTIHAKWDAIPVPTYTVTFNSDGGSAVASQTVDEGAKATRPTNPTKEGYTFDNWYTDSTYSTVYDFNTAVTDDITLVAKWTPVIVYHTVTYYDMDGSVITTQSVENNTRTTRPSPDPTKTGYTFVNWYTDTTYTTTFDFRTYILADTPIYAKFVENPTPTNYDVYVCGYDNATCSTAAIFANKTVEQLLLGAIESHMVTDTQPFTINTTFGNGEKMSIYYIMLKEGIEPDSAELDSQGFINPFDESEIKDPTLWKAVHSDITINGDTYKVYGYRTLFNNDDIFSLWVKSVTPVVTHQVSFDTDGGSSVPTQTVQDGYTATKPNDPTKSGYTFVNWYTDNTYSTVYDFTTPITADVTIYAKFDEIIPVTYTVSFDTHGGSQVADETVVENGYATRPADPTKTDYIFDNWYNDTTYTTLFDFANTQITGNTTIHANWTTVPVVTHTVTFYDGATVLSTQTVNDGGTATQPADPVKSGYTFDNWYADSTFTNVYDFSTVITADTDIYAKFTEVPVTTKDIYIGGIYNITLANFRAKTDAEMIESVIESHDKTETQPFTITTTFGNGEKSSVYYVMIKSGVEPVSAELVSGGFPNPFDASEIKDSSVWRATHDDVTIGSDTFKVYGYRTLFNNDDTMSITIQ